MNISLTTLLLLLLLLLIALNEMYVKEEDFTALRESIDQYENFDQLSLAQNVEKHVLLEFRRIASYVYKKNKRWRLHRTLPSGLSVS